MKTRSWDAAHDGHKGIRKRSLSWL